MTAGPVGSASPVLAVTVTHNTGETLRTFLDSLIAAAQTPPRIVVVDNASDDVDDLRAIAEGIGAEFLALRDNLGYGAGVSEGVKAFGAGAEFILVTNPDVIFPVGAIDKLVESARRHPSAGTVGPRILESDGTVYPSARSLPSLRTGLGHALFANVWPANPWTSRYRGKDYSSDGTREVGWLSGACLIVRKDAYDSIGGFDPSYFMYFEDVDLGARLSRAGWRNLYDPSATVVHTGAHSTSKSARRMQRVHHDSAYLYLSRKYAGWYLAPLRWVLRIGLDLRHLWSSRG